VEVEQVEQVEAPAPAARELAQGLELELERVAPAGAAAGVAETVRPQPPVRVHRVARARPIQGQP
jgi:hypothetical protein